jgi:hypothetical protein
MADTETELREVIEAQEVVIRAGADMLREARIEIDRLWGHLDRETKLRESIQTLYNERIASPRRRAQGDARIVEARLASDSLFDYLDRVVRGEAVLAIPSISPLVTALREALA